MKTHHRFWSLLKYEMIATPMAGYFLGMLTFINIFLVEIHPRIGGGTYSFFMEPVSSISFFVFILASLIFAPGLLLIRLPEGVPNLLEFRDFIFTRAIHRITYFRAKSVTFIFLTLIPFLIPLGFSVLQPGIIISPESHDVDRGTSINKERFLKIFPNSKVIEKFSEKRNIILQKGDISIPKGRIMVYLWIFIKFLYLAIFLQAFVLGVSGRKFQKPIFWTVFAFYFLGTFGLLLLSMFSENWEDFPGLLSEESFLFFCQNWIALSIGALVMGILLQPYCEWRFRKMEALS